ncbi:hypothetical protein JX265_012070 [Neoarthrinium moseri]|uniref:Peptidase S33 tripeptidyl aminopeptidase-like C-terminal domain-containing protein n=1 Tax=Neoarthrinium moseri TaxID=1658444 RepID=A0A9P9WBD6_9PEZI|nr:hypothetical protein JX265_012070 [Neoarthrinium moseri]
MKPSLITRGFLAFAPSPARTASQARPPSVSEFDWSTISASPSLNYTACYDAHHWCAKLLLPLDWLDPHNTSNVDVSIAIIGRSARVAESDPRFGGTIIVNPGGPGASGVDFVLRAGELAQRTVDSDTRAYEILSFDPRGVGISEPHADCYGGDEFARSLSVAEDRIIGWPDEQAVDAIKWRAARAEAFGRLCSESGPGILAFMSTSSVARDMVEIVDRIEGLRNGEQIRTSSEDPRRQRPLELRTAKTLKDDTPRIQFWGFSYGTILGNYFASMFPGRIGRMVLEGVEDVEDHYRGTLTLNVKDTQKVLSHFYETCHEAKSRCVLHRTGDQSPLDIRARVEAFLDSLSDFPAPFVSGTHAVSITKEDILERFFRALYQPQRDFPAMASTLDEAMAGNFTRLFLVLARPQSYLPPSNGSRPFTWSQDAHIAVIGGDAKSQANLTIPDYVEYLEALKRDSPDLGAAEGRMRLDIRGWRVRPRYRFTGPWTTPEPDTERTVPGRPAAPLLFVSSRLDPVTPLANANAAARAHSGSRVLVQENAGHGSLFSPGACREGWIKRYFESGELPPEGTVCEPDCRPFMPCGRAESMALVDASRQARGQGDYMAGL